MYFFVRRTIGHRPLPAIMFADLFAASKPPYFEGLSMRPILLPLAILVSLPLGPALGQSGVVLDNKAQYENCMRLADETPEEAYKSGIAWFERGGGSAAEHCVATALMNLGNYREAATRLAALAETPDVKQRPTTRGLILSQAAQAWSELGEAGKAAAARDEAVALAPDDPELRLERAIARIAAGQHFEAIDDLNRAAETAPRRVDVLLIRASAYRYLGQLELARDDVDRALAIRPDFQDAILERGVIFRAEGDKDSARRDFLWVLDVAPEGPAGDAARMNLEEMDVRVE